MILWLAPKVKHYSFVTLSDVLRHEGSPLFNKEILRTLKRPQNDMRRESKTANTTALNHCVDCIVLKQSRRLTKS